MKIGVEEVGGQIVEWIQCAGSVSLGSSVLTPRPRYMPGE